MQALISCPYPDETAILSLVLQQTGFVVSSQNTIEQTRQRLSQKPSELILIVIPGNQNFKLDFLKDLRAQSTANIIIISNPVSEEYHIALFENGADMVIQKPYNNRILIAEIRALLRRTAGMPFFSLPILSQSGLELDPSRRTIRAHNAKPIHLTQLEFRLIFTLMTHAGQVIPNTNIVEHVWGYNGEGGQELIRGLVKRLRSKIEPDQKNPQYIIT